MHMREFIDSMAGAYMHTLTRALTWAARTRVARRFSANLIEKDARLVRTRIANGASARARCPGVPVKMPCMHRFLCVSACFLCCLLVGCYFLHTPVNICVFCLFQRDVAAATAQQMMIIVLANWTPPPALRRCSCSVADRSFDAYILCGLDGINRQNINALAVC